MTKMVGCPDLEAGPAAGLESGPGIVHSSRARISWGATASYAVADVECRLIPCVVPPGEQQRGVVAWVRTDGKAGRSPGRRVRLMPRELPARGKITLEASSPSRRERMPQYIPFLAQHLQEGERIECFQRRLDRGIAKAGTKVPLEALLLVVSESVPWKRQPVLPDLQEVRRSVAGYRGYRDSF